jgi:hypothetical protein
VSKKHVRNTKDNRRHLEIEGSRALDTMFEDTKGPNKYIGDVVSTRVYNISYFIELKVDGKHNRQNIGECLKGPNYF